MDVCPGVSRFPQVIKKQTYPNPNVATQIRLLYLVFFSTGISAARVTHLTQILIRKSMSKETGVVSVAPPQVMGGKLGDCLLMLGIHVLFLVVALSL